MNCIWPVPGMFLGEVSACPVVGTNIIPTSATYPVTCLLAIRDGSPRRGKSSVPSQAAIHRNRFCPETTH